MQAQAGVTSERANAFTGSNAINPSESGWKHSLELETRGSLAPQRLCLSNALTPANWGHDEESQAEVLP